MESLPQKKTRLLTIEDQIKNTNPNDIDTKKDLEEEKMTLQKEIAELESLLAETTDPHTHAMDEIKKMLPDVKW